MVTKEQINRINELAKKQKEVGLSEEEKSEQATLRRLYVDAFKENLKSQLKNIKIVSEEEYAKQQESENTKCGCGHNHSSHGEGCNCSHDHGQIEKKCGCNDSSLHHEDCDCSKHKN